MTLTECKQFMRRYRGDTEENIVQFNWRTTARWALRHRWAQEENDKLKDELRHATEQLREHGQAYKSMEASAMECKAAQEQAYLRATIAEEALAERNTPCVWRVEAPAHFVGHMDDKPLEMMLMSTSCGKELGVHLPPTYCAYCGHPIELQP